MINMATKVSKGKFIFDDTAITKDGIYFYRKTVEVPKTEQDIKIEKLEKRIDELESKIDFLNYLLTKHGKELSC